ncbi:unnamed protein product, partial [Brenthis ino]
MMIPRYHGKEHGYLIMNHSYEVDWLMGWHFCDGIKVLGNCKAYAKKSIQYLPPIGWIWKFSQSREQPGHRRKNLHSRTKGIVNIYEPATSWGAQSSRAKSWRPESSGENYNEDPGNRGNRLIPKVCI